MCYPILSTEWDAVLTLALERNVEELEWLLRLLTTSNPYSGEHASPIAQAYPWTQDAYSHLVHVLWNLFYVCALDDEEDSIDWTDETHGLMEDDFIYLDDDDLGLALGLLSSLYRILLP